MSEVVVYDAIGTPKVTLLRGDSFFEAVVEVDDLDPQRGTSAEERAIGVLSLNPPKVRTRFLKDRRKTHRALIAAAQRAVASAATSTTGTTGGPGGLLMTHFRVARGIRMALRMLDEDI